MKSLVTHKQREESHPVSAAILGLRRIGHFPVLGDCYFVSASLAAVGLGYRKDPGIAGDILAIGARRFAFEVVRFTRRV